MTEDKAIYFQDPSFRYAVLQVIIQRLMESYARYTNRTSLSAHMFAPMRFPHARRALFLTWLPFASKLLRFRDLFWGHLCGKHVSILFPGLITCRSRQVEPHVRGDHILRNTNALGEHDPEIELSRGKALVGRVAHPGRGGSIVLRNTPAFGVHACEKILGCGV